MEQKLTYEDFIEDYETVVSEAEKVLSDEEKYLSPKQRKLPEALKKGIIASKKKNLSEDEVDDKKDESLGIGEAADLDKEFLALAKPKAKELEAAFTKEVLAVEKKYPDADDLSEYLLDYDGYYAIEAKVFKAVFGADAKKMIAFSQDEGIGTKLGKFVQAIVDKVVKKVSKMPDSWE